MAARSDLEKSIVELLKKQGGAEKAAKVLMDGLKAKKVSLTGHQVPDWKARLDAAKLIMAYIEGLPIQRQHIVSFQANSLRELREKLPDLPELRAAVIRLAPALKNRDSAPPTETDLDAIRKPEKAA